MKAMVYQEYGTPEVLELKEIEKPTPKEDEVLVRVHASTITPIDWHFLTGTPYVARILAGLFKPRNNVLGTDVAGRVEAIGAGVKHFTAGDEVIGGKSSGGYAEFATVSKADLYLKPAKLSFEEAAAVPFSAFGALFCLCELGQLKSGQKVLINGASGGVGTLSIPIAIMLGAQVTAVCSTGSMELVRSLGADQVVDYSQEDFAQSEASYDLIFDVAAKRTFSDCKRALTPEGVYITTEFSPALVLKGQWISRTGIQKMIAMNPMGVGQPTRQKFEQYLLAGKLNPVIDSCFPLSEVPDAFRHYQKGHIKGRIAVTI